MWFLFFGEATVFQKFDYFDGNTSIVSLLVGPIAIGVTLALIFPWVRFAGAWLVREPLRRHKTMEADARHNEQLRRLEKSIENIEVQARLDEARELAKIKAAIRLEEAGDVGGDDLKTELEATRITDDKVGVEYETSPFVDVTPEAIALLKKIANTKEGAYALENSTLGDFMLRLGNDRPIDLENRKNFAKIDKLLTSLDEVGLLEKGPGIVTSKGYEFLEENPTHLSFFDIFRDTKRTDELD